MSPTPPRTVRSTLPLALAATLALLAGGCGFVGGGGGRRDATPSPPSSQRPSRAGSSDARPARGKVVSGTPTPLPFILWGGDMVTFHANGGKRTLEDSLFGKLGLNFELVAGDDFDDQVRRYKEGTSPFLRGTFRMLGMVSEELGTDPATRPMVFMQLTWSAGDHLVARDGVKTLADLKGKTIAIQRRGPHEGMLFDLLEDTKLDWNDVQLVWVDDITGARGPAEALRRDPNVAAAFVVTPDMIGLTGGLDSTGTGAEGTVPGARVLVSTAERSRTIVDVYAVRTDYYREHPEVVEKLAAGYLKGVEEVIDAKRAYESTGSQSFESLLAMTQEIYGRDVIPVLDEAHGLISDCTFVGHPGNVAFFTDEKNPHGFAYFQARALDLAVLRGYARRRVELTPSLLDWNAPAFINYLTKLGGERGQRFDAGRVQAEIESMGRDELDARTVLSFSIKFEPNQIEFDASKYGKEYAEVIDIADKYGNAVVAIRGHSDPTLTLAELVKAGIEKGVLKRGGTAGDWVYSYQGRPLELKDTERIVELIQQGAFDGAPSHDPREVMQAARSLSLQRAQAVRASIESFARTKGRKIDPSQLQAQGVGIRDPFFAKPRNMNEAGENRRVEFRVVRILGEAMRDADFDF